jgi:hypothetical protein
LSEATREQVERVFEPGDVPAATELLVRECGNNLPFCDGNGPVECERTRFAALKLSGGRLDRLREAIALAKIDWRDLLMAAGFGHDVRAHHNWVPERRGDA